MRNDATPGGSPSPDDRAQAVRRLIRRQAALSLRIAAVFIALLVLLPLLNLYFPAAMSTPEWGFTLTWLFLGVLFFPITWLLSAYFVRRSDELEHQIAKEEAP